MNELNNNIKKYKLNNGLVVALKKTSTRTISGELNVNYGPYHEKEDERGISHFLEHCLVTGGSEKYDIKISDRIRSNFGYSNAQTTIGRISTNVKILSEDLELWLDYISNGFFKPELNASRFKGEKSRILREIQAVKSNPYFNLNRNISDIIFRGHPRGIFVMGHEDIVNEINKYNLREFHSRGFHPNNTDLILVGDLPENIEELVEKYFGDLKIGEGTRVKEFPKLENLDNKYIFHENVPELYNKENPEKSSVKIMLRLITPSDMEKESAIIKSIAYILSHGSTSRLFQKMGLKKGLAYDISTRHDGKYNAGNLIFEAYVPALKIQESIDVIFAELGIFRNEEVKAGELEKIKKAARYAFLLDFDSNDGHITMIKNELDYGETVLDSIKRFRDITPEAIKEVANKYLPKNREEGKYVLVISDPLKK